MGVNNFLHSPRSNSCTIFIKRENPRHLRASSEWIGVPVRSHCCEGAAAGRGGYDVYAEKARTAAEWFIMLCHVILSLFDISDIIFLSNMIWYVFTTKNCMETYFQPIPGGIFALKSVKFHPLLAMNTRFLSHFSVYTSQLCSPGV